jgi:hypothetical protein
MWASTTSTASLLVWCRWVSTPVALLVRKSFGVLRIPRQTGPHPYPTAGGPCICRMAIRVVESLLPGRAHRPGHRLGPAPAARRFLSVYLPHLYPNSPFCQLFPRWAALSHSALPLSPPVLPGFSQPLLPLPQRAQPLEDPAHPQGYLHHPLQFPVRHSVQHAGPQRVDKHPNSARSIA